MQLRPYQSQVLDDLWSWFESHGDGNPIVEASVGAGKSVMLAEFCKRALGAYPGTRVLMCVHVKELCEQNLGKLLRVWPGAPAGVHSASMGRKDLGRDILYATIGSVYAKAHLLGRVDLLLVDECHLIGEKDTGMYRRLIDELRQYNPALRVIGWTGTAFRGDGVWLTQGGLFSHVAARVSMRELLDAAYLAPLTVAPIQAARIDASNVRMSGGDFVVSALAGAADKAHLVREACAEIVRLGTTRRSWLVFAVTVEHAGHVRDEMLHQHGIDAALVSAKTPKAERAALIRRFRSGQLKCLVNVAVLTTGFDAPEVDLIALLRPTRSPVLYVQIAGRGMRTAPGKSDCLWLDFTDTTTTLGPVDAIKGRAKNPPGTPPIKYCDECGSPNTAAARACVECEHLFPPPALPDRIRHAVAADSAEILSDGGIVWTSISGIEYRRNWGKEGKPDSLRVDYYAGMRRVASEWVCLEHEGYPRRKAEAWWAQRCSSGAPATVDEALERTAELAEPGKIAIREAGKYLEVVSHRFITERAAA